MFRNLLSTTGTRLVIAFINLGIVWLTAHYMGAAVLGTVSLITLGISIIQLVTAILAGSSIVYQASRRPVTELMTAAWIWIPLSGIPVWVILLIFNLIPTGFLTDVLVLAILGSLVTINQNLFLGKEKINLFNSLAVLQSFLMLSSLAVLVFFFRWYDARAYIVAQYFSIIICALTGIVINLPPVKEFHFPKRETVAEAFKFGGYLQGASIMQLFNYRLSYYLIEKFFDRATLGVFSLGVQIAESVWIIGKSLAILLYSRLSNNRDPGYSANLTVSFIKLVSVLTVFLMLIIVSLPDSFFTLIFKSEFGKITGVVPGLAPGILAVSVSLMLSHYFSGTGDPRHNTISSGIGLVFTIVLGLIFIPRYGLIGAAIITSVSYISSMLYQLLVFKRKTLIPWKSFLPGRADVIRIKEELKSVI